MKNLDGFNYFMVTALLSLVGFKFYQEIRSNQEIWKNIITEKQFIIKQTKGNLSEKCLTNILEQAGLTHDDFLKLV